MGQVTPVQQAVAPFHDFLLLRDFGSLLPQLPQLPSSPSWRGHHQPLVMGLVFHQLVQAQSGQEFQRLSWCSWWFLRIDISPSARNFVHSTERFTNNTN
jgi:hypothetical protein